MDFYEILVIFEGVAQLVKVLVASLDYPDLMPSVYFVEGTDSYKLFSDLHSYAMTYVCPHTKDNQINKKQMKVTKRIVVFMALARCDNINLIKRYGKLEEAGGSSGL